MKYCLLFILIFSSLILFGCKEKEIKTENNNAISQPTETQDGQQDKNSVEDDSKNSLDKLVIKDSNNPKSDENNNQNADNSNNKKTVENNSKTDNTNGKDSDNEEYLRSTNDLSINDSVTLKEFEEDKAAILKVIEELSVIMETKNANEWLKYLEPNSINYYSTTANLIKVQKKLPNKSIHLRNITDYFNYVFIPSRQRSKVDEIRYISKTNIKAVQVKDDNSIVVYYYFTKVDGKWLVHLPPLS